MKAGWLKSNIYPLLLAALLLGGALFYYSRINHGYVESTGDNYTYEIFAQTVFTSHPFKVNIKFDFYEDFPIYYHQSSFPPLHPIFLALLHLVFGHSMWVNFYATSLVGIACALPVYLLGKRLASEQVGLLAAFITLLSPTLRDTSILGMSEPLFTLLTLWTLYYLVVFWDSGRSQDLVLAGIFTGLSYLTRPTGLALALAGIGPILLKTPPGEKKFTSRLVNCLIFLAVTLGVASPWLIRNYLVFGDPLYYVGRFSAGRGLWTYYATLNKTTIGEYLSKASWAEIFSRYLGLALAQLIMIFSEIGVLCLLALWGGGAKVYQDKKYLILWSYLIVCFLFTMLNPGLQIRHLVNIFPVITIFGAISLASMYRFAPAGFLKKFGRQFFLAISLLGIGLLIYQSCQKYPRRVEIDNFSPYFSRVGAWFIQNTPANTVIMSDPTSPVAYYSQRPVVMFPRHATTEALEKLLEKFQVDYIFISYQNAPSPLPRDFVVLKEIMYEAQGQDYLFLLLKNQHAKGN